MKQCEIFSKGSVAYMAFERESETECKRCAWCKFVEDRLMSVSLLSIYPGGTGYD